MKTIAVKLPEELLAAIQYAAKKRGETNSAIMCEALQEFLFKNRPTGSCRSGSPSGEYGGPMNETFAKVTYPHDSGHSRWM